AALLRFVGSLTVQRQADIAIAEALQQEVSLSQAAKQLAIRTAAGIESTDASAMVVLARSTQRFQKLAQRRRVSDGGEAFGQAVIGGVADFATAGQIGDALEQLLPGGFGVVRFAFLGAIDLEALGIVDGGFDAEGLGL